MRLEATNPVSGDSVNLTNPRSWARYLLGFGFLFFVFNIGQWFLRQVSGRVPGVYRFGSDVPFMDEPATVISGNITTIPVLDYGEAV